MGEKDEPEEFSWSTTWTRVNRAARPVSGTQAGVKRGDFDGILASDGLRCGLAWSRVRRSSAISRKRSWIPTSATFPKNDGGATTAHVAAGVMDGVCGRGEGEGE